MTAAAISVAVIARLDSIITGYLVRLSSLRLGPRTTFQAANWIEYINARYEIEREPALFFFGSSPCCGDDATQILITRVEEVARDSGQWWASRSLRVGMGLDPTCRWIHGFGCQLWRR